MKYENKKNNRVAMVVETDDKAKTTMLQYEDDNTTTVVSNSTLKRWWKALKDDEVVEPLIDLDNPITKQEAEEKGMLAGDEAVEQAVVDPDDVAGDGTPLAEVGKEIAEQAKEKALAKPKKKKEKADVSKSFDSVKVFLEKAGYYVKQYDKEPKIIPVSLESTCKKSFCNIYLGATKCVLCMKLSEVPDGYTPSRVRKCPLGAAFDVDYGNLQYITTLLSKRKLTKKEEK